MNLREQLISFFKENGKEEVKTTKTYINGKEYVHHISSYTLNDITIEQRYEENSYAIVLINNYISDIYLNQQENCIAFLDDNLDLHFNHYTRLNEYIISGYNEIYDFIDKFKIKSRLEDNSYYNRTPKITKL